MQSALAGAFAHRCPPYLDVLVGLNEHSAVTCSVHFGWQRHS